MNEVRRSKNVILFVDELHTLVGAGGAEGSIDASNVLKPALARGEVWDPLESTCRHASLSIL